MGSPMLWGARPVFATLSAFVMLVATLTVTTSASAAQRDNVRVSIANVEGSRMPPVGKFLGNRKPHVMVLTEVYKARKHLRAVADRKGYRLRQYTTQVWDRGSGRSAAHPQRRADQESRPPEDEPAVVVAERG
ncbi:MAG: hypothetical protein GEV07_17875 [Streptosporangiales bacterium]|nr:hypothetical protein [Streptosporangiales bacterium]